IGRRIGDLLCPPILILAFDCFDGGVQGRFVVGIESPVSLEDLVGNRLLFRRGAASAWRKMLLLGSHWHRCTSHSGSLCSPRAEKAIAHRGLQTCSSVRPR